MYKKRKKTRRYDNGGMTNDDDFTRQDSTDVYDYRNLINFFDGLDPARTVEAASILSRGDENIYYNKLFRKMRDIKELNEKMGDLGDFNPNKKAAGGMVDDDDFTRQDSVDVHNYRIASDILGADPHKMIKFDMIHNNSNPSNELMQKIQKLRELRTLSESMGELGDFMPVKGETTTYASGGTVDDSNQPDSIINHIKGHNNNDMKKNKKYGMGGINNPNDNNFSQQDSTDVYDYRQMRDFMGEDPVRAHERRDELFKNTDVLKNLKRMKELNLDMGDLGDFKPKKKGGMVGKSKGGNRDPFTNQYD